ncbi:LANO_0G10418g1_1 [Lachancea nothofagi CBS 11611]|uniref:LANO_0G10418g1_1 n=1 Tax=Lachancea nothofagi CBS 11611 TaxID=1266666 RepID=A0A1G4KJC6_9SACH|nr:LANO_0G10418g1_1 [Lachancea nothofagi CBS 11611]
MSNQSGITANESLLSEVALLIDNASTGEAVVAEISPDNTAVQLKSVLSSLEELREFVIAESKPFYIFIHGGSGIVFVSYVPERSPVRAKMLYASTKNTVLRQIGSNHISKQLLFSSPEELTPSSWTSDFSRETAPLTDAEQISASISQQQQFETTRGGQPLVSQTGGTSHTLSFKISSDEPIPKLLTRYNLVIFAIDLVKEEVEVLQTSNVAKSSDIPTLLKAGHPTYNIYKNHGKFHFIYSCPSGSKVKERMLYASNKSGFIKHLSEVDQLAITSVSEIGNSDELELSQLDQTESTVQDVTKPVPGQLKFSRPKRPGRRA